MMKVRTIAFSILISSLVLMLVAAMFYPIIPGLPLFLIPALTISLPALYFKLFKSDMLFLKTLLITTMLFLVVVNVVNLLGFWFSYQIHYGDNATHLILWDNVICFSNSAALLSFGGFLPFLATTKKWWISILIYSFVSVTVCGIASLLYSIAIDYSPSPIITLLISLFLCAIGCITYSSLKHKLKAGESIEKV